MKIAIMGSSGAGVMNLLMNSLSWMLSELKADYSVFPQGMIMLAQSHGLKRVVKKSLFRPYMARLREYDVIVVVQCLRNAFGAALQVEALREIWPTKPIILYDAAYFSTIGLWGPWLEPSGPQCWGAGDEQFYGLGRYDWYMCISSRNRNSMPPGEQPCSQIGPLLW